jgi:hypothetical protein
LGSILVVVQLAPFAQKIVNGTIDLNASLYETILPTIDYTQYQNDYKGCSKTSTYLCLYSKPLTIYSLMPEALCMAKLCSTLYKVKKK